MTAEVLGPADRRVGTGDGTGPGGGTLHHPPRFPGARLLYRVGDRLGRRGREVAATVAGSLAVSCVMTWPVLRDPAHTVPQDLVDPLYFVWQIAWTGHALRTDPAGMWTTNAFGHAGGNLAYTDTVLGYAPFAAVFDAFGGMGAALLSYNLLYVLVAAMAFGGAYFLARVLGARVPGALVLASAYGFAPWRLGHARHLNVLSTGGIVLALALLAYGHGWTLRCRAQRLEAEALQRGSETRGTDTRGSDIRPGWIVAGWAVACWQLTLGFAVGVPFAWALAGVLLTAIVLGWRQRPWDRRMVRADAWGGAAFALTGLALTIPYELVVRHFPAAARTEDMVHLYSPLPRSLLLAPSENWWWGGLQTSWRDVLTSPAEQTLLPGLVLTVLAVAGLRWSAWSRRARAGLAASAVLFAVLALGVSAPGSGRWTYLIVFRYLPGWEALRTPGRLVLWCGLALGLLAAGAVTYAAERLAQRPLAAQPSGTQPSGQPPVAPVPPSRAGRRIRTAVLLVPAVLVLSEGAGAVAQPVVLRQPVSLRSLPGPVLVIPTSMQRDYAVMTWSTDGWPDLINGGSGFEPPRQSRLRRTAAQFPSVDSARVLRKMGVRTIVLVKAQAPGTAWQRLGSQPAALTRAQAYGLGATMRDTGPALIFDLDPPDA